MASVLIPTEETSFDAKLNKIISFIEEIMLMFIAEDISKSEAIEIMNLLTSNVRELCIDYVSPANSCHIDSDDPLSLCIAKIEKIQDMISRQKKIDDVKKNSKRRIIDQLSTVEEITQESRTFESDILESRTYESEFDDVTEQ